MRQILDNIYRFPFMAGFINVFLVETSDGLMLIDTGTSAAQMHTIADALKKQGRSISDIKHIFITHAHNDHIGGLPEIQKLTNAQTYAHRREAAIIRGEAPMIYAKREDLKGFMRVIAGFMPPPQINAVARVDTEVKEGSTIINQFDVIDIPGHAYGHIALWWRERRILFGGDVVAHLPWGLIPPFAAASPDIPEAKRSIKKVAALKPDALFICHGAPLIGADMQKLHTLAAKL